LAGKRLQVTHLFGTGVTPVEMFGHLSAPHDAETVVDKRVNVLLRDMIVPATDGFTKRCRRSCHIAPVRDAAATRAAVREMIGEPEQHGGG
jgi:hypothetical protein